MQNALTGMPITSELAIDSIHFLALRIKNEKFFEMESINCQACGKKSQYFERHALPKRYKLYFQYGWQVLL